MPCTREVATGTDPRRTRRPPQLRDVRFSGGDTTDSPLTVTWTAPKGVRAGSKVEIGVYEPSVCQVGNSDNRYGGAVLPVRAQRWVDDSYVAEDNGSYCYEIRIINRWGLGAAPFRQLVSREPTPPAAPFVRSIAEYPDESADYVVDAVVPEEADLHVDVTPTGECTTQYDETRWSIADSVGAGLWALYDVPVGPVCLSFYSVDWNGVASGAVTREVAHAPRPG